MSKITSSEFMDENGKQISPLVSIILPVYNGSLYLRDSIESIFSQEYQNFECIIIDDGSTDDSREIIKSFSDKRIRFFTQRNKGLAATLNKGVAYSRGLFLARHDQDDIVLPERLGTQVSFLMRNPDVGLVGTWAQIWKEEKPTGVFHKYPSDDSFLRLKLLFDNPFVHSSVMIRKSITRSVGVYSVDPSRQPPEDYEYWSRISRKYSIATIPEVLQIYRETKGSMSRSQNSFVNCIVKVSSENISHALGVENPDRKIVNLSALYHGAYHLVKDPDIGSVLHILREAAGLTVGDKKNRTSPYKEEIEKYSLIIRNHYYKYTHGKYIGGLMGLFRKQKTI